MVGLYFKGYICPNVIEVDMFLFQTLSHKPYRQTRTVNTVSWNKKYIKTLKVLQGLSKN